MESAIYLGGFFIIWGLLYWVFAFVGKESDVIGRFFKVPGILLFLLPDRMFLSVGRVLTGILCMGVGVFLILKLAEMTQGAY